jgi:hypothetical protein
MAEDLCVALSEELWPPTRRRHRLHSVELQSQDDQAAPERAVQLGVCNKTSPCTILVSDLFAREELLR